MRKAEEVKAAILSKVEESLNRHLFSDKAYPIQIIINTEYKDCKQTLTIKFDGSRED